MLLFLFSWLSCLFLWAPSIRPCRPISVFKEDLITGLLYSHCDHSSSFGLWVSDWLTDPSVKSSVCFPSFFSCSPLPACSFIASLSCGLSASFTDYFRFPFGLGASPTPLPSSSLIFSECLLVISEPQSRALGVKAPKSEVFKRALQVPAPRPMIQCLLFNQSEYLSLSGFAQRWCQ